MKTYLLLLSMLIAMDICAQVRTRPVTTSAPAATIDKSIITTTTSTAPSQADVNAMYDQLEASIEAEFAKAKKEIGIELDALKAKVAEIDRRIAGLRKQVNQMEKLVGAIDHLMPQLVARKDSISQSPGGGLLDGALVRQQNSIDSLYQVRTGLADHLLQVNGQINLKLQEKHPYLPRISQLEADIVLLDKQKAKLLADLRKQREQALEQVAKQNQQVQLLQLEQSMRQRVDIFLRDSMGAIRNRAISIQ